MAAAVVMAVTVLLLPAGTAAAQQSGACARPRPLDPVEVRDLGPAVEGLPVNQAARLGDRLYVASMDLEPMRLLEFDLDTRELLRTVEIPAGIRAWGMTVARGDVYLGLWNIPAGEPNLYRFDPESGEVAGVARIPSTSEFWALDAAADGTVFAGTDRADEAYAYDPADGGVTTLDFPGVAGSHVGAVAATQGTLYVGIRGQGAGVYAIDRATGNTRTLLDPERSGLDGVYTLDAAHGRLAVGVTGPDALVLELDPVSGEVLRRETVPDDAAIEALLIDPSGVLYAAAKPSGRIYALDASGGPAQDGIVEVARPVRDAPNRSLHLHGDHIVGASAAETVWALDPDDGAVTRTNLVTAGADGAPVAAMSLHATAEHVFAGGNNRLQARDIASGDVSRRIVPGEVKDLADARGTPYLALYPYGELWSYDVASRTATRVADWPDEQNRPRSLTAGDPQLFVGTHADDTGTGALVTYDLDTEAVTADGDVLPGRGVATVVPDGDVVYLGGEGADAPLAAIDAETHARRWQVVPAPGAGEITGIVVADGAVHVMTATGTYAQIDATDGSVRRQATVLDEPAGEIVVNGGAIFAVSRDELVRIEPDTAGAETVLGGLDARHFDRPRLTLDADCRMYLLSDGNVVQATV